MAVATIAALMVTIDLANTGNPVLEATGNSNTTNNDADLNIEGAGCYACGYSGAVGSTNPATSDFSAMYVQVTSFSGANRHLGIWLRALYPVHNKADGGVSLYLGDNTNRGLWYATGADESYSGGWYYYVLNIDSTGPASDLNYGTEPGHTGFTRVGSAYNVTASKGEAFLQNQYFDAVRRSDANNDFGLRYTGGTSGDRLTLANLASADTSAYGTFIDLGGGTAFSVAGAMQFGNAASTIYLQDNTKTVIFRDLPVASTFYKVIGNDGTTGVSNIDLENVVWQGASTALPFDFDMSALATGDTGRFVANTFIFGSLVKFGAQSTVSTCKFVQCADIQPNGITVTDCVFENSTAVALSVASDKILGGSTNLHATAVSVAFITTNDLTKVEDHVFDNTGGTGHAIEITAIGTYTFTGNTFTGYGITGSTSAAIYNNSGGLVTINIAGGGTSPTYRNGTSSSTVVNVSVSLEINNLTEGSYGVMIGNGGAENGVELLAGYADSTGKITGSFGGTTPQNVDVKSRNAGIVNAAIQHDEGGVDTDYTNAARNFTTGTGTGTANDVNLLPAVPALNDAFYIGGLAAFSEVLLDITTVGTTYVLAWEYWIGAAWSALTVVDNTNSFQTSGWNTVSFTAPSDWATTSFNTQGPFYYIRARVTTGGGVQPKGETITLNNTVKYLPFNNQGTIATGTGLTTTVVWIEDVNNS